LVDFASIPRQNGDPVAVVLEVISFASQRDGRGEMKPGVRWWEGEGTRMEEYRVELVGPMLAAQSAVETQCQTE